MSLLMLTSTTVPKTEPKGSIIELSDIIAMSVKKYLGKWVRTSNELYNTASGPLITPATGKTFYLGGGLFTSTVFGASASVQAQLTNEDGVILEKYENSLSPGTPVGNGSANVCPVQAVGESVVGNGVKKMQMTASTLNPASQVKAWGSFFGYFEDSADNPLKDFE